MRQYHFLHTALTYFRRVDPNGITEQNWIAPEILAWRNDHLGVLVEMNKFMELEHCIKEDSLFKQVLRAEEIGWKKKMEKKQEKMEEKQEKMEEKQEEMVALLNQIISLQTRDSGKAEQGGESKANLFNLPVFLSAAFLFGFLLATYSQ